MNHITTPLAGLTANLTAHRDDAESLLMVEIVADDVARADPRPPMQVALVLDRSGSMCGDKLQTATSAVARFVRSLSPEDRVAVVAYDDRIDLVAPLEAPSEALAQRVERIDSRGSTNLYGGWLAGAKLVGRGGRVVLLSDGLANVGRFTDAEALAHHAGITLDHFGVTTSTIGVGRDYDEGLMSRMAHRGGGAHYFAHDAAAIADAFAQERFSADAIVIEQVTVKVGGQVLRFGHFWGGETKRRVGSITQLEQASIRFTPRQSGLQQTLPLQVPAEFGHDERVRLEWLFQLAADAEAEMVTVRDPRSAGAMREVLRSILLRLLAHPAADDPEARAVLDRVRASMERLTRLERDYREEDAMVHRKRSMQSSHNLRERAQAYSSFEDEKDAVRTSARRFMGAAQASQGHLQPDPACLALAPLDRWIGWKALPLGKEDARLVVALEDPRSGFVVAEMEKELGLRVRPVFAGVPADEIVRVLTSAR